VQCHYQDFNYVDACKWANIYNGLASGQITLATDSPIQWTIGGGNARCILYDNAYATHAVIGTYSIQHPTVNNQSGLATFVFAQGEQAGPWQWVNLTINEAQYPQA